MVPANRSGYMVGHVFSGCGRNWFRRPGQNRHCARSACRACCSWSSPSSSPGQSRMKGFEERGGAVGAAESSSPIFALTVVRWRTGSRGYEPICCAGHSGIGSAADWGSRTQSIRGGVTGILQRLQRHTQRRAGNKYRAVSIERLNITGSESPDHRLDLRLVRTCKGQNQNRIVEQLSAGQARRSRRLTPLGKGQTLMIPLTTSFERPGCCRLRDAATGYWLPIVAARSAYRRNAMIDFSRINGSVARFTRVIDGVNETAVVVKAAHGRRATA